MHFPGNRTLSVFSALFASLCVEVSAQWQIVPRNDGGLVKIAWAGETVVDQVVFSGFLPGWKGGRFRLGPGAYAGDSDTGAYVWNGSEEGRYRAELRLQADESHLLCTMSATVQPEGPIEFGIYFPEKLFTFPDGTCRFRLGSRSCTETNETFGTQSLREPLVIDGPGRSVRATFSCDRGAFVLQDHRQKRELIRGIVSFHVRNEPIVFRATVELNAESFSGRDKAARAAFFGQPVRRSDPVDFQNAGFESGVENWSVPGNAGPVLEGAYEGESCMRIDVKDVVKDGPYVTRLIPIRPGAYYEARCVVRTENVEKAVVQGKSARGAVFIVEWADKNKKWFAAGQYSKSRYGTTPWAPLSCDRLRAPDEAGYAVVFLALRGTGAAWFDDIRLIRVSRFAVLKAPLDGDSIRDNTPTFEFDVPNDISECTVELSKDASFTGEGVLRYPVESAPWSCPTPLATGRWHWRVVGTGIEPGAIWSFNQEAPVTADTTAPAIRTFAVRIMEPKAPVHVCIDEESQTLASVTAEFDGKPVDVSFPTHSVDGEFDVQPKLSGEWSRGLTRLAMCARDSAGNETTRELSILYLPKPPNPVRIDEQGFYRGTEGRQFPFGIYQVTPAHMQTVKEAGFDAVHVYRWESSQDDAAARAYLDAAWEHGLRVFVGFDRGKSSGNGLVQGNLEHIVRRVAALCDHPGLFCWYLFDEPEIADQYISPRDLTRYADLIRQLDPYHPVVVTTWGKRMNLYRKSWDTHWTQAYRDPAGVVKQLQDHRELLLNASPITLLVHAYDRVQSKSGKTFDLAAFQPDPAWLRAAPYAGITQGINGLFWWWYAAEQTEWLTVADVPEAWEALSRVVKELRSLSPVFTANGPVVTDTVDGGEGAPHVELWQKTVGKETTMIAVNTSENAGDVVIPLRAEGGAKRLFGENPVSVTDGRIKDHFDRYSVHVYRW